MSESQFKKLFEPVRIGQMQLKNRIVMPPMGTKFALEKGYVSQRQIDYYEARAKGGTGLIITEITAPDFSGRNRALQVAISDDSYIPGFRKLAEAVHKHGAKIAIQLHHAGREINSDETGYPTVGPSAIPTFTGKVPQALTIDQIEEIVRLFAAGARRAKEAGADGVEIHGCHHYLIASFLSAASNQRQDKYGGSVENRARILIEIVQAVINEVGADFPVWVRLNGKEYGTENGVTIEETRQIAKMAVEAGAKAVHISAFAYGSDASKAPLPYIPGFLLPLAEEVKKAVSVPVIAVGRLDPETAERALEEGKADLVAFGRRLLADPDLPNKAAEGRLEDINPCIGCMECLGRTVHMTGQLSCTANAATGHERECQIQPADKTKDVVVIGGGPAGMETARVAGLRGHRVVLFEKESRLGGLLNPAAKPPYKQELLPLMDYLSSQVKKAGVDIRLSTEATPEVIMECKPDAVVVAVGGTHIVPDISGASGTNVVAAEAVLSGKTETGQNVVIIGGGMVGCETGHLLAEQGKTVTTVEITDILAEDMMPVLRERLLRELKEKGVTLMTGTTCEAIEKDSVTITTSEGRKETIKADTVILAVGYQVNDGLYKALQGKVPEIYCIGDCCQPAKILEALTQGYRTGLSL